MHLLVIHYKSLVLKYTELKAVETTYDNVTSGLDAENVQEAIDELEGRKS